MANVYIPESIIWTDKVRMIEKKDPVLGGLDGPANWSSQDLANRTAWLKNQITLLGTNKVNVSDWDLAMIALTAKNKDQDDTFEQFKLFVNKTFDDMPISSGYSATRQYKTGDIVKVDGIYHECYHPDGCKGKDPRDKANRPSGWVNTDVHAPYHWIEIGKYLMLPEIGSPVYLMTMNMREGLIKLRNDAQLSAKKFWRIAELNPNLVKNGFLEVADLRANVIRSLDDGKGIDNERVINSYQEDMTQKVIGTFPITGFDSAIAVPVTGPFATENRGTTSAGGNYYGAYKATFDNSKVIRAGNEERIKNIAMLCTIRI